MTRAAGPFVSVVTPFYNTEDYLAECIESVLAQSYGHFEYVLLNNCSTDRSAQIAARYAERDSRIRLIHNDHLLPQVENYNQALRQISPESKYCKIVQADDWIFPNCLQEMVQVAESAADVALVGSYSLYDPMPGASDVPYVAHTGLPYQRRVLSGDQCLRSYLVENVPLFGSPTCMMFRTRDVLARPDFFNRGTTVEDIEACLEVLQRGQFGFVHQVLSFNRREPGSFWWRYSGYDGQVLHRTILAQKYAPIVLAAAEGKALIQQSQHDHYRALGHAILNLQPRSYWRFHAQGLAYIGKRIEPSRVAIHLVGALLDWLSNPKLSLGNWLRTRGFRQTTQNPAVQPKTRPPEPRRTPARVGLMG